MEQQLPDSIKSETFDLEVPRRRMAPSKGTPTQACVDDEGCSGSGAPVSSPSVENETALRQVSENQTSRVLFELVGEEETDSSARKLLSSRWTKQHLSAVAMNVLTNGHNSEQVSKRVHCAGSLQIIVWVVGGRTRISKKSTTPSQQHEGHQDSRDREWRSRPSLHCCHGWSDNVIWWITRASSGGKERVFQLVVQIQRRRPRTSSRTRVSETGAATACEPELLTIHIADNHTEGLEHMQALQGRGKPTSDVRKLEELIKEHYTRAAGPPPNKFSEKIASLRAKWIIRFEDDRACDDPQSDSVTAMKLKIKDLDYVKKLGQQSRTTSTHSPVLVGQLAMPSEGCRQQREQAVLTRM